MNRSPEGLAGSLPRLPGVRTRSVTGHPLSGLRAFSLLGIGLEIVPPSADRAPGAARDSKNEAHDEQDDAEVEQDGEAGQPSDDGQDDAEDDQARSLRSGGQVQDEIPGH